MSAAAATIKAKKHEIDIPAWEIVTDYVETCNCDYSCPCNFSGFPTYGFCRAIVLYHIREGFYGETNLKGTDVVYVGSWPKAIHEGDGTLQIYASKMADAAQREALVRIMHGKAKGNGSFALFATTMKYVLEPQFVDIEVKIDGRKSFFLFQESSMSKWTLSRTLSPVWNPIPGLLFQTASSGSRRWQLTQRRCG